MQESNSKIIQDLESLASVSFKKAFESSLLSYEKSSLSSVSLKKFSFKETESYEIKCDDLLKIDVSDFKIKHIISWHLLFLFYALKLYFLVFNFISSLLRFYATFFEKITLIINFFNSLLGV